MFFEQHRFQFESRNKKLIPIKPYELQLRRDKKKAKSYGRDRKSTHAAQQKEDAKRSAKETKRLEKERKKLEKEILKKKNKKKKKKSSGGWFSRKKKTDDSEDEEEEEGTGIATATTAAATTASSSSSDGSYQFSNSDREKLFNELNFDPANAAKDQAERMRILPASYQLFNINILVQMISITLVDEKKGKKEAILRLEVPLTRVHLTVQNGLMDSNGTPVPNIILRYVENIFSS